jgi:hypothetical protein
MFYLKVSEQFKGNHAYWKALYKAIQVGEVEAMVYELLTLNLNDFSPGNRPASKELLHQKIQSLPSFERFWFSALWDGEIYELRAFSNSCRHSEWQAGYFWKSKDILEVFEYKSRAERYHTKLNGRDVAETLRKICPSSKLSRKMENGDRASGYELPDLATARTEFAVYLGGAISWPKI